MGSEFAIGIVSSLCASALAVAGTWLVARYARPWWARRLAMFTGTGILRAYAAQRQAAADITADLRTARWVKILAGRGSELTRETFAPLWQPDNPATAVAVLLPDPADPSGWVRRREDEVRRHDPGYRAGILADQISTNVDYATAIAAHDRRVAVRLYDLPHTGRIVITDRVAYLTTYTADGHGREAPCYALAAGSPLYHYTVRQFDLAWDGSRAPHHRPVVMRPGGR